jgi:hypothetical protein
MPRAMVQPASLREYKPSTPAKYSQPLQVRTQVMSGNPIMVRFRRFKLTIQHIVEYRQVMLAVVSMVKPQFHTGLSR